jgi:hypothetical protein
MQSVPIITNVESSNVAHGEMYSIQHFVKKLISNLRQVSGFLRVLQSGQVMAASIGDSKLYLDKGKNAWQ